MSEDHRHEKDRCYFGSSSQQKKYRVHKNPSRHGRLPIELQSFYWEPAVHTLRFILVALYIESVILISDFQS